MSKLNLKTAVFHGDFKNISQKMNHRLIDLWIVITESKIFTVLMFIFKLATFSSFLMMFICPAYADTDQLQALGSSVNATFGAGSTFMKLVYSGEILISAIAYIKTKNMLLLCGVAVLAVSVNFFMAHFGVGQ